MENKRKKVTDWIRSGMGYQEGIGLLIEFSNKKGYSVMFAGKEKSMKEKLAYEICKYAKVANHVNWKKFIRNAVYEIRGETDQRNRQTGQKAIARNDGRNSGEADEQDPGTEETGPGLTTEGPANEYPVIIKRIMHDMASLYQERSKYHTMMVGLGNSNRKQVVRERSRLFDKVKELSERFDFLYRTKQEYLENQTVPDEMTIYPEAKGEDTVQDKTGMSAEALKKMKKNLQSANSKDQKKLDTELINSNEGTSKKTVYPRRMMVELRIRERIRQIEEIDYQLINKE